jgi:hypothetical protein
MRSVMTQSGVYFTLDAPFISIIGVYSNVLDTGGGVISSQGGHFPIVDDQLDFIKSELTRLKPMRKAGERAVVLAVHHPPLSADAKHGGSTGLQNDIDACCKAAGLWPDILLSGHAHLYQRFTRILPDGTETPYIVAGCGGFAATAPKQLPKAPITVGDHRLEINPIVAFGYLTVETDARTISVTFKTADGHSVVVRDSVAVDLAKGKILPAGQWPAIPQNAAPASSQAKKSATHKRSEKRKSKAAKRRRSKLTR